MSDDQRPAFIADTRATLKRDPGPQGRESVRTNLERLLANKDFVAQTCGEARVQLVCAYCSRLDIFGRLPAG